eukprot:UN04614
MAASVPTKITATAFKEFSFLSSMPLTPSLCSNVLIEFMKQILYTKGQIPILYEKLIETDEKTKDVESDQNDENDKNEQHLPIKSKKRLNARDLKLNRLSETMNECQTSIHKMFQYHYQNNLENISENSVIFLDILLLFGKSYLSPLETYSLRFYMNANDNNYNDNYSQISDKNMQRIKKIIAKRLNEVDKIWDSNLPLTDCRVCINAHITQDLHDSNFTWKQDLFLRFQRKKSKKNKNNVYVMNFWNKNTAKKLKNKYRMK